MSSLELAKKIRLSVLEMIHKSGASHIASTFSIVDIIAVLYEDILRYNSKDPNFEKRDRFILSKGHAGSSIYAVLAEKGFLSKENLNTYYQNGSRLSGHISHKDVPGVEVSTGSLGHGAGIAAGIALALKLKLNQSKVYTLIGDGECNEGAIWELAMFCAHHKLDNFVLIIDQNKFQALGKTKEILDISDLEKRFTSFGWDVLEVDGHNHKDLKNSFHTHRHEKPLCIIADTIKGKGVSFMENNLLWHYRDPQDDFYRKAKRELERE